MDCRNIKVMERRKESLKGGPFEVLHSPTNSSGKYEHSPRVGVAVLFSEVHPLDELRPCRIQKYDHRMPTMVERVKRRIHVTDENERSEDGKGPRSNVMVQEACFHMELLPGRKRGTDTGVV